jgi:transcriptional regulator with XRE-family HTH domain
LTPASFLAWRKAQRLSANAAAKALGCSRTTLIAYELGKSQIPRYVALACAAIAAGLNPMAG